jgi:hypothetical protein
VTKDAAPQAPGGEGTAPPFDEIQPGTARGDEGHVEPRMPLHPSAVGRMLVGRIVVHDKMQRAIVFQLAILRSISTAVEKNVKNKTGCVF